MSHALNCGRAGAPLTHTHTHERNLALAAAPYGKAAIGAWEKST